MALPEIVRPAIARLGVALLLAPLRRWRTLVWALRVELPNPVLFRYSSPQGPDRPTRVEKRRTITAIAVLLALLAGVPTPSLAQTKPFEVNGLSFPLIGNHYLDDQPGWTPIPVVIEQLKSLGVTDVKVSVSAGYYKSPTDNLPDPDPAFANPPDEKVIALIRAFKAAGLRVILDPGVLLAFDPNGNLLDTTRAQPTDFKVWLAALTTSMLHLADLGRQGGADRFNVITDFTQGLTSDAAHQDDWLAYIAKIRAAFPGVLTGGFAGDVNNNLQLTPRPIIDALDEIGIGWFPQPITNTPDPALAQLIAGWRSTVKGVDSVASLRGFHEKYGKPVLIIDSAFHSFSGDNVRAGDIFDVRIPLVADQQEQANEYDSFLYVMSQNKGDWLKGVVFDNWNRFPLDYTGVHRFLNSPYGENIRGKLAESVLSDWFNGRRTATPAAVEFHHAAFDHYFMTNLQDEITKLDAGVISGWQRTGYKQNVYGTNTDGAANVCRFFSTSFAPKSSHFYTPLSSECSTVKKNSDWTFEGEVFGTVLADPDGACLPGMQRLYRLYNNGQGGAPNHRYTTSPSARRAMMANGWIPEGNGPLGVTGCVLTDGRDNVITLRLRAGAYGGAPDPSVSVSIDGKTVLAPIAVKSDGSLQEIRIDTTDFEPVSNAIEIAAHGEPGNYPVRYTNIVIYGVVYQGQNIDVAKGQYNPPGSSLINNNTLAVLNTGSKVIFPASVLPRFDP